MRWPFGRAKGRHALGAAVTAIPSGPVTPPVPVQRVEPHRAEPPVEPEVVDVAPAVAPPSVVEPVPAEPEPTDAVVHPLESLLVAPPDAPVEHVTPERSWQRRVEEMPDVVLPPVDLMPVDAPPVEAPRPVAVPGPAVSPEQPVQRRVELGFRDGTSSTLDPESPAAQALSDLVAELTGSGDSVRGQGSAESRR